MFKARKSAAEVCLSRLDSPMSITEHITRPAHLAFFRDLHRSLGTGIAQALKIRVGSRLARHLKISQVLTQRAKGAGATCLLGSVSELRHRRKGLLLRLRSGAFKLNRSISGCVSAAWWRGCSRVSAWIGTTSNSMKPARMQAFIRECVHAASPRS